MPEICRFFGIIIYMFFADHNPPHFHVKYNEYKAVLGIKNFSLLEGNLPPKVMGLVVEWAVEHQKELLKDWEKAENKKPLVPIEPLK
jgi:hypothetical protein